MILSHSIFIDRLSKRLLWLLNVCTHVLDLRISTILPKKVRCSCAKIGKVLIKKLTMSLTRPTETEQVVSAQIYRLSAGPSLCNYLWNKGEKHIKIAQYLWHTQWKLKIKISLKGQVIKIWSGMDVKYFNEMDYNSWVYVDVNAIDSFRRYYSMDRSVH